LLVYLRPFFSALFFRKLSKDFSFPGVRRCGNCLLGLGDLAEEVAVVGLVEDVDLEVEEVALEGDERAFTRLRAAEVVSVRSK
jgi:hypothetical protein